MRTLFISLIACCVYSLMLALMPLAFSDINVFVLSTIAAATTMGIVSLVDHKFKGWN